MDIDRNVISDGLVAEQITVQIYARLSMYYASIEVDIPVASAELTKH